MYTPLYSSHYVSGPDTIYSAGSSRGRRGGEATFGFDRRERHRRFSNTLVSRCNVYNIIYPIRIIIIYY